MSEFDVIELKQDMEQSFKTQDNDCSSREMNLNGSNSGINLDDIFLDFTLKVPDPIVLLSQKGSNATIFTEGNLSLILGLGKSRKTTLVVGLSAALLGNTAMGMEAHGENYTVVVADTEQGLNLAYKTGRMVLSTLGKDNHKNWERFKYADLRKYDKETRLKCIEAIIEKLHPTVIFIDGLVDLCDDFNDIHGSAKVIQKILEMAANSKTHICCCLHFNKDGKTERGHLGAMYMQKCETTLAVRNNNDCSICKPQDCGCRHLPFKAFRFTITNKGIVELVDLPQDKEKPQSAAEKAMKLIESGFAMNDYKPLRYSALVKSIQDAIAAENLKPVGEKTAKNYIKAMVESGFIIKSGDGRNMIYVMSGHDQNQETQTAFNFSNPQPEDDEPAPF